MPRSSPESSFQRLWLGFLGARVLVALALLALQVAGGLLQQPADLRLLLLCSLYLVVTLATRWLASPKPPTPQPGLQWLPLLGVDLLLVGLLQWQQAGSMNYTPLFGIPILMASVLALRRSPLRTSVASGVAVAAGWWLAAQLLLWAVAPPPAALPAWQGVALDGRSVAVQQLRGQAVVVNLWASWCPPCHREMPVLLQAQAQQPQVQFLWVNQGEAALKVHTYAQQQGLPAAQVLLDPQSTLGAQLGQRALPTTLFFNARGELVAQRTGELSAATLAQHLALALAP